MVEGILISKTRVGIFLRSQEVRIPFDFYEALNENLKATLALAAKRARKNFRSTVMAHDL